MNLRATIMMVSLLALAAAHLAYDGYFYATGHDLPDAWDRAMTLWLLATSLINTVEPEKRVPTPGLWLTAFKVYTGVFMLSAALYCLGKYTELGPALGRSQVKVAIRIAADVAIAVAAAILLVVWRRERHAPASPLAGSQP